MSVLVEIRIIQAPLEFLQLLYVSRLSVVVHVSRFSVVVHVSRLSVEVK